jgi:hypothetical protein
MSRKQGIICYMTTNTNPMYILQGDDARIFRKEIERIGNLPEPEYKTGLLTENAVKFYL